MPTLFWTGQLSFPSKLIVNMGSVIAWITGNARNTSAMKQRMKNGYNAKYSDYVHRYDELGASHYVRISRQLMEGIDCTGKEVIDVGCGTGILSLIALEKGAAKMVCVDISTEMLEKCKAKITKEKSRGVLIEFHEADAEKLPFNENSYDVVLSNMVLGIVPNQLKTITELTRVLRSGGIIALSTHGPTHYMEAIEYSVKSMTMRYFLGHRFEFWPRHENQVKRFFVKAGLESIYAERSTWIDEFKDGGDAFDFFASTSSLWWYDRLPRDLREEEAKRTREYFQRKEVKSLTSDVVLAYGIKS